MKPNAILPMMLGLATGSSQSMTMKQEAGLMYTGRMDRPAHYDSDERLSIKKTRKNAKHRQNPAGTKLRRLAREGRLGIAHKRSAGL